ncbi:hypothetical protein [Stenotrophomonas panacihumi]|uniref:hypothetical protein n=1 Tax=Stenotrophomonas panacihumi TaxID=676599 RepID=UPI000B184298|nr:hypothetical protein [Stenotrophomonas panacihumi]
MDMTSIGTAFTAIDLIRKGLSAAIDVRDFNKAAAELAKLNDALLSAQSALLAQNSALFNLQREKFETAEELRKLKEALAQKDHYPLVDLGGGVFAYRVDAPPHESGTGNPSATQVAHYLCQPCWDGGKRSVLQRYGRGVKCPLCDTFFNPQQGLSGSGYSLGVI